MVGSRNGSSWATRAIGRVASAAVRQPRQLQATHTKVHQQPDTVEELIAILTAHAEEAGLAAVPAMASLPHPLGEAAADAEASWRPKRR